MTDYLSAARDRHATLTSFTLDALASYTREGAFRLDDSPDFREFYVGRDDVHGVLKYLLAHTSRSLRMNMFGYDDEELNDIIVHLVETPHVYVQGTLDRSQAGGVHERKILATWTDSVRSSFAVGQSETHQISHTKGGVCDGIVAWTGSTNWSASGEGTGIGLAGDPNAAGYKAQNNTLTVYTHPVRISYFTDRLDEEHAVALTQERARKV